MKLSCSNISPKSALVNQKQRVEEHIITPGGATCPVQTGKPEETWQGLSKAKQYKAEDVRDVPTC